MLKRELIGFIKSNYDLSYEEISQKLLNEKGIYKSPESIRKVCSKNRNIFPPKKQTKQLHGSIQTTKKNIKSILFIADVHLDYDIDTSNCYKLVKEFARRFKPDCVVLLGDFLNFDVISKFTEAYPREREKKRLKNDFKLANKELDFWCNIANEQVIFIEGNHENRIQAFIDQNPSLEGLLELPNVLKVDQRPNMEFVPINIEKRLYNSNLYAVHGAYHNLHHAKKHVETYNVPHLIYGHLHIKQAFTKPTRSSCYTAESIGCLSDLNPKYLKNKPSTFQNGFGIAYVDIDNGQHTFYNIVIDDDQFIFNGEVFKYEEVKNV